MRLLDDVSAFITTKDDLSFNEIFDLVESRHVIFYFVI